jgi:hypothetical protein
MLRKMLLSSRKMRATDACENNPPFLSKETVHGRFVCRQVHRDRCMGSCVHIHTKFSTKFSIVLQRFSKTAFYDMGRVYIDTCSTILQIQLHLQNRQARVNVNATHFFFKKKPFFENPTMVIQPGFYLIFSTRGRWVLAHDKQFRSVPLLPFRRLRLIACTAKAEAIKKWCSLRETK